jgi:hypothetical protein
VLVSTGDAKEPARANSFFPGVIFIEVGTLNADDPDIVGVGVHAGVVSGAKFGKRRMCSLIGVTPERSHRDSIPAVLITCVIRANENYFLHLVLPLHSPNPPRNHQHRCHPSRSQ